MKQQSALEMLVVYSWAVLLIGLFVALALVISGSTAPSSYLPGTCSIQPLLPCAETLLTSYSASSPITFTVEFVNQLGVTMEFPADALNVNLTNIGSAGSNNYYGTCNPSTASSGSQVICTATIPGSAQPSIGSQTSASFSISYYLCAPGTACNGPYISTGTSTQPMVASKIKLSYISILASPTTGRVVINGVNYYSGTNAILLSGKYTVYGSPPPGYTFSSWAASGNVLLGSQTSQSTIATVSGNGTLSVDFTNLLSTTTTSTISTTVSTLSTTVSTLSTTISTISTIYYVPITLTNSQSAATPAPFQQMIVVPSSTYSSYINSAWSNVQFTTGAGNTGTVLQAWVENNASNTAAHTVVWVNLPSGIGASSGTTIYMDFMPSSVMSASGPTGEAPQLSSTYGQYDNGAAVFLNYLAGSSLSGWTTAGTAGQTSSAPSGNPAFGTYAFYANGAGGDYLYTTASGQSTNMILEYYTYTANLDDLYFLVSSAGAGQMMRVGNGGGWYGIASTSSWTSWAAPPDTGSWPNEWVTVGVVVVSGSATGYLSVGVNPYSSEIGSNPTNQYTVANDGDYLGLIGDGASGSTTQYWSGIIVRAYPPSDVMPSVSFGSVA